MLLSVIIVNYNVRFFLEQCLFSVQKAIQGIEAEILVVDNASTDGSREYLPPRFPAVRFFWKEKNTGFANANNYALALANGEFILFLNPDTIVPEDVFMLCTTWLRDHPDVGGLGTRMIDGTGKFLRESKRAFPSPKTAFYKLTGLANVFPASAEFARYHLGHLDEKRINEVDVLSGAYFMTRKKLLDEIGAFDESFFMYGEDIDLSYRIKKAGYKNVYFAGSTIIHFKGESTQKGSFRYVKMFYAAMGIFVRKHYSGARGNLFQFFIQLAIVLRAFFTLVYIAFRPVMLTAADSLFIFVSFIITSISLNQLASAATGYPPIFSLRAPIFYWIVFFIVARLKGLYITPKKKNVLSTSVFWTTVVAAVCASWLSEVLYLDHLLVLGTSLLFFILAFFYRMILSRTKLLSPMQSSKQVEILLAGSASSFKKIQSLCSQERPEFLLRGRIAVDSDRSECVCALEELTTFLSKNSISSIIFCENGLSYKRIIQAIDGWPFRVAIRVNANASTTIVGSDSKDDTGETISG